MRPGPLLELKKNLVNPANPVKKQSNERDFIWLKELDLLEWAAWARTWRAA
jgi:hypothetical protein